MTLRVVIPCKGLDVGKKRLAAHLSRPARARLNAWLLTHTIRVMRTAIAREESVVVVSPDAAALGLARLHGALGIVEPIGCGLNAGLALSRPFGSTAAVDGLLIVPVDLPLLDVTSAADLVGFARAAVSDYSIGIVADRASEGTNALAVPARASFEFNFGPGSMRLHYGAAAHAGLGVRRAHLSSLAFDLDEPGDFAAWSARADFPPALADLGFTRTAD